MGLKRPLALVLDTEGASREVLEGVLGDLGFDVRIASSAVEALALLSAEPIAVAFVDLGAEDAARAGIVGALARPHPPVVGVEIASGPPGDEDGEPAFFDRVEKPLSRHAARMAANRARNGHALRTEAHQLREDRRGWSGSARLGGRSEASERFREKLASVACRDGNALFVGEPGTGKELSARIVHEMSARRKSPFVRVECAGAAPERVEAELFGDDGALRDAAKGVLFLREIAELAFPLQERLARHLGAGEGGRGVGFEAPDVRVLAATERDLGSAVADGRFHEDLYRHVAFQVVRVPPLRERAGDASHLAARFLEGISELNDLPLLELTPEARWRLDRYSWPGNVAELRRVMEQAALLASDGRVLEQHLPEPVRLSAEGSTRGGSVGSTGRFREAKRVVVEAFEKSYLQELMERRHGNVTAAAEESGMLRSALQRLLRKYDLRSASFRSRGSSRADSRGM
jgi:two-component system nitrogen regulation response regulator NtrX